MESQIASFFGPDAWHWLVVPLLIFLARISDVSIGTLRIIFVTRGRSLLATVCGFFEVLIWLLAITQIMNNLTEVVYYLAYALGYAAGNYVGIFIEERLAMGMLAVRVITRADARPLTEYLEQEKFGVTSIAAKGLSGRVRLLFTIIKRKDLEKVIEIVNRFNPKAFVSVEDVRAVSEGNFPHGQITRSRGTSLPLRK